jgi:hypothetical protein
MRVAILFTAACLLAGCSSEEEPLYPPNGTPPVVQDSPAKKSADAHYEHAMTEWARIEAESPMNAALTAALGRLRTDYDRRCSAGLRDSASPWLDRELSGKSAQIIAKWGEK